MAGYPISELKKASESKGRDLFPIQQDGVTRQVELGILSNASKITASTSSGVITKEGSYVLQNNSAVINFTLNNAVGRAVSNNDYVDSASAAAGWIIKVINLSTRSHTVIAGSNSWTIAAGDVHEYYWTGSAWTFHNVVTESRLNNALAKYQKFAYYDFIERGVGKYKLAKIKIDSKGHANLKVCISSRMGNVMATDGEYSVKVGYIRNDISKLNGEDSLSSKLSIEKDSNDDYYVVFHTNTISTNLMQGNIKVELLSSAFTTVTIPESLTVLSETTTEVIDSNGKDVITKSDLRHYHANTINYGLKIKIMEKVSEKGTYFNAIFSWTSYGSGNYISLYLLRFSKTEITTKTRLYGNTTTDTAKFTIENDDLYFYPNGDTTISGGGGAYNLLLS